MEKHCHWAWNGQTYAFDITDPEHMGRLIIGLTVLKLALAKLPQDTDADWEMATHSETLAQFFTLVLGESEASTLCGRCSPSVYALAYLDFMDFISAQLQWLEELLDAAEQRYRWMGVALGWCRSGAR